MEEKMFALPAQTCINLESLQKEQGRTFELSLCELSFAAEVIADSISELAASGMSPDEILTLMSEEDIASDIKFENTAPSVTRHELSGFFAVKSNLDRLNLISLILKKLEQKQIKFTERDYLYSIDSESSFAYVKNSLADEAFDVFSQEFSKPTVSYLSSFKDCCAAVADGKVGYCILPFEEGSGARIPAILSLISSFDLKINAITPVFGYEGNADIKYALIGRGFTVPDYDSETDRYLEIEIGKESGLTFGEVVTAAEYLSNTVFKVETVSRKDGKAYYSMVLKDGGRGFTELLTYLLVYSSDFTPIGVYKNIE